MFRLRGLGLRGLGLRVQGLGFRDCRAFRIAEAQTFQRPPLLGLRLWAGSKGVFHPLVRFTVWGIGFRLLRHCEGAGNRL